MVPAVTPRVHLSDAPLKAHDYPVSGLPEALKRFALQPPALRGLALGGH